METRRCVYEGFSAGMGIVVCSGQIDHMISPEESGDAVWRTIQVLRSKSEDKGASLYLCEAHATRARECGLRVESVMVDTKEMV